MNIYDLLNSRSIAQHWEEIDYKPDSLETAWLVFYNNNLSFDEKCRLWEEIINTMPDMEIRERVNCRRYDSLHDFLYRFMALSRRFLDWFYDNTDCVYTLKDADHDWQFDAAFSSVDSVKEFLRTKECTGVESYIIKKITVDKCSRNPASIMVNKESEPVCQDGWNYGPFPCGDEYDILSSFEGMWFNFPVPFRKGDVIYNPYYRCSIGASDWAGSEYTELFVVKDIGVEHLSEKSKKRFLTGENGDTSDMNFCGFAQWRDGSVYSESFSNYMDFEFYQGEFKGFQRIIKALSNYEKGLINDELLMHAYHQILSEERAKYDIPYFFTEEGLELAGINLHENDGAKLSHCQW